MIYTEVFSHQCLFCLYVTYDAFILVTLPRSNTAQYGTLHFKYTFTLVKKVTTRQVNKQTH